MIRAGLRWSIALGVCAVLAEAPACTNDPIVLATIPVPTDEGGASMPIRCSSIQDCPSGSYCEKLTCDATVGTCQLSPAQCEFATHEFVCGCDGVTYFDDCLRKASGTPASTTGQCPIDSAKPCGGTDASTCPVGAYCAHLVGEDPHFCGGQVEGYCWVLPPTCPAPPPGSYDRWTACEMDGGAPCVDTCTAVRSGEPYFRDLRCH